jgi:hypothetical protein
VTRRCLSYWVPEAMAAKNRKARRTPIMAVCARCEKPKPHRERSDRPGKPQSVCLDCQKAYLAQYREERWAEEKLRDTLKGMINRCHRPDTMKRWAAAAGIAGAWRDYGAAGVKVCDGLRAGKKGLDLFREVVGLPPTKAHTLDRIDPYGSYTCGRCDSCREAGAPTNIRWADKATQDANRKNARPIPGFDPDTGDFVELTITEWARRLDVDRSLLARRLKALPIERVLVRGPRDDDAEVPDLTDDEVRELEADEPEPIEEDTEAPF